MAYSAIKDPSAILDYQFDWEDWLGEDTISTSDWIVPDGITEDSDEKTDTATTIWLSGGSLGSSYTLVNEIVTAGGRKDHRTLVIHVQDK